MGVETHPQAAGLLDEIHERPEDDVPRRVLADWLQENGPTEADRARGEWIAVQCRLGQMEADDPGRPDLVARELDLRTRHEAAWLGPWRGEGRARWHWERGLLHLTVSGVGWLRGPFLRPEAWAWFDTFTVTELQRRSVARLARTKGLARLNGLSLAGNGFLDAGLREVLASPHLTRLVSLNLDRNRITWKGVDALAAWPGLVRLRRLSLEGNPLRESALRALLGSPHLGPLTELNLGLTAGLGTGAAELLAGASGLSGLTSLRLYRVRCGDHGVHALAASPHLGKLRKLDLGFARVGVEGIRALAASRTLTRLTHLHLPGNGFGDAGVRLLAGSPNVADVTELILWRNEITDEGVAALAGSPHLGKLVRLHLNLNPGVTDIGVAALCDSPHLGKLETVSVASTGVTGAGLARLRERFGQVGRG